MSDCFNKILLADVLDGLKQIPDNSVSLILTSPPYNVGINYENHNDTMPYEDYCNWLNKIFTECYRVLRKGGRLIVNHDSTVNHQEDQDRSYFRPTYAMLCDINHNIGFNFFTDIAWYKHQVVGRATAWGSYASPSTPIIRRNHEYLIVWSKDTFKLEGDIEQADIDPEEFEKWTMSFWYIKPETRNMGGHPVPFPEELVKRVIKMFTYRNDVVLDPFVGSGTTAYVAKTLNRRYIGIDNSAKYVKFARERLESVVDVFNEDYIPRSVRLKNRKSKKASFVDVENDIFGDI